MAPVVHRIADRHFQHLRELFKAPEGILRSGDIRLGNAICAEKPPFIVIAGDTPVVTSPAEPQLAQVFKAPVLADLPRIQVAVVIDERQLLRVVVKQMSRRLVPEQKVPVHEIFHPLRSPLCIN